MSGISPKLPLETNGTDGHYGLTKTVQEAAKQNLKNLILTSPGERVMDPSFGVGIREMLFEQNDEFARQKIFSRITDQVSFYLPYIEIINILFNDAQSDVSLDPNSLAIRLEYRIIPLNDLDLLDITIK